MSDGRPRPIPVRELLAAEEEAEAAATPQPRTGRPQVPVRTLEVDGTRWTATPLGTTRTGEASDAGAILLLVRFAPAPEGSEGDAGVQPREALAVARSLDEVDDDALKLLWERARTVLK